MKKFACLLLSALLLLSLTMMGGCSDFSFNPIGEWEYTTEIYYIDGKEIDRLEKEDMQYNSMKYVFEKSGTGYIIVDDERTLEFTYDYDDNEVILHMEIMQTVEQQRNHEEPESIDIKYSVSSQDGGKDNRLIRSNEYTAYNTENKEVQVKEEYVLFKL